MNGAPPESIALSAVIPAHNSGPLIERTAQRLAERLDGRSAEVIVVENGSSDDTWDRCTRLAAAWTSSSVRFRPIRSERGMGNALRAGLVASAGDVVLLSADDLPFAFDDLDGYEEVSRHGGPPAFAIGSKAHSASMVQRGARRQLMTRAFSGLCRIVLGMRTRDPQGTLILDGDLARDLVKRTRETGFLFSTELVHVAECLGIRPVELPVRLADDHVTHASRVSLSDVAAMAIGLVRLRFRHRRLAQA